MKLIKDEDFRQKLETIKHSFDKREQIDEQLTHIETMIGRLDKNDKLATDLTILKTSFSELKLFIYSLMKDIESLRRLYEENIEVFTVDFESRLSKLEASGLHGKKNLEKITLGALEQIVKYKTTGMGEEIEAVKKSLKNHERIQSEFEKRIQIISTDVIPSMKDLDKRLDQAKNETDRKLQKIYAIAAGLEK